MWRRQEQERLRYEQQWREWQLRTQPPPPWPMSPPRMQPPPYVAALAASPYYPPSPYHPYAASPYHPPSPWRHGMAPAEPSIDQLWQQFLHEHALRQQQQQQPAWPLMPPSPVPPRFLLGKNEKHPAVPIEPADLPWSEARMAWAASSMTASWWR